MTQVELESDLERWSSDDNYKNWVLDTAAVFDELDSNTDGELNIVEGRSFLNKVIMGAPTI